MFDEQVAALGHRLVRYGDALIMLTPSEETARAALDQARALLTKTHTPWRNL